MTGLTKRQSEIYRYLIEQAQTQDFSPTIGDVCVEMGVKSRGSMHKHIQSLIKAGLVEPFNEQRRGIKLTNPVMTHEHDVIQIPLLGKIAAGSPLEAIENPEVISIPSQLYNGTDCFALTVKGESMIGMGIYDGDWVVIEKTNQAKNGDVIVALIDGEDATLKRFEKRENKIILHPENIEMESMVFNPSRVIVQGKLIAHMRKFF